jgi:hypothetical protein
MFESIPVQDVFQWQLGPMDRIFQLPLDIVQRSGEMLRSHHTAREFGHSNDVRIRQCERAIIMFESIAVQDMFRWQLGLMVRMVHLLIVQCSGEMQLSYYKSRRFGHSHDVCSLQCERARIMFKSIAVQDMFRWLLGPMDRKLAVHFDIVQRPGEMLQSHYNARGYGHSNEVCIRQCERASIMFESRSVQDMLRWKLGPMDRNLHRGIVQRSGEMQFSHYTARGCGHSNNVCIRQCDRASIMCE